MEVTHSSCSGISEGGANQSQDQSECISSQPTSSGMIPHPSTDEAPPALSDRSDDDDLFDDSLTGNSSTNDIFRLLPSQPVSAFCKVRGVDNLSDPPDPVCIPPSSTFTSPSPPPPLQSSTCNRHSCSLHHHHHQSTSKKRSSSLKTDAAHIKEVAGDDCCAHCLLACLYCELLSMCSALGDCLLCGISGFRCCDTAVGCCCVEAACTEEACQAVLDCGILEDCCGSSDCMEICLECCSICFPS